MANLKRLWFLLYWCGLLYVVAFVLLYFHKQNTSTVNRNVWKLNEVLRVSVTKGSVAEASDGRRKTNVLFEVLSLRRGHDARSPTNHSSSRFKATSRIRRGPKNLSLEEFVDEQLAVCKHEEDRFNRSTESRDKLLCECFPQSLHGDLQVEINDLMNLTWTTVESQFPKLDAGGHWKPGHCVPRRRVAIIIPYRDRKKQLLAFLAHVHPILQRQLVEYQIFVVEQRYPYVFNKGGVMNAGYLALQKTTFTPDCIVFHDVDMLMLTDISIFMCLPYPVHLGAYLNKFNFTLGYKDMFGGAVSVRTDQFKLVNGFSNKFKGWGGEDDDFHFRVIKRLGQSFRSPRNISRYFMIPHKHDIGNPIGEFSKSTASRVAFRSNRNTFLRHGLNTIKFQIIKIEYLPLFTHILLDLTEERPANASATKPFTKFASNRCASGIYRQLPVSEVTCEGVCLRNAAFCQAFQFVVGQEVHLTCQLLSRACEQRLSDPTTNLYVRK